MRLKGLYVSDDLHEAIVGNTERTFGQEGGVVARKLRRPRGMGL